MEHPGFYERTGPITVADLLDLAEASPGPNFNSNLSVSDVVPLDEAGGNELSFFDNSKYLQSYRATQAGACFASERYADQAPEGTSVLISKQPYRSFALALTKFYPTALYPCTMGQDGEDFTNGVHATAELEDGVVLEPGVTVGPEVKIGQGTVICAGARIGYRVCIGRNCYIGPNVNLTNTLIGDRVTLHSGVSLGQDGFGFAMGPGGHLKVPQIGRVIIQDNVEIGANSTVDRGALRDTIIGEGTKIDNLVQIGHNVIVGRHCVIVSQTGIAGSVEMGDGVVLGGQVGISGHVKIGSGAQLAATSSVIKDVPPGAKWGGTPAKPLSVYFREIALVQKLTKERSNALKKGGSSES